MVRELLLPALVGLLPVLSFLAVLLALDSYKLVKLRVVVAMVAAGAAVALASYFVNGRILEYAGLDFQAFTRYVAPVTEELLKALVIVALVRAHRVGFLVDAAIFGFAVGAGFAAVENLSAGSFSSAVSTASSTCRGIVCRLGNSGRGCSVRTFATMDCAVGPVNGGSPARHSYSTHPSAYTSARGEISRSPIACSGAM